MVLARTTLLLSALLTAICSLSPGTASASSMAPVWSRPLSAPPTAIAQFFGPTGTRLYLLFRDGRIGLVAGLDTLVIAGRAPAGATALAAADSILFFAAGGRIIATDPAGHERWHTSIVLPSRVDSLAPAGRDESRQPCFYARAGTEAWFVVAGPDSTSARRIRPDFTIRHSLLADIDGDSMPELVAAGASGLLVADADGARDWNCPDAGMPSCADIDADGRAEVLCLTDVGPDSLSFDSLRCISSLSTKARWSTGVGIDHIPARAMTVLAGSRCSYVAGATEDGAAFVAAISRDGRQQALRRFAPHRGWPTAMLNVAGWPAVLWRDQRGLETFQLLPPGLAGSGDRVPGYNGVRINRLLPLQLDPDTFPDLVVVRTAADAPFRIDVFRNELGRLQAAIEREKALIRSAVLRNDEVGLQRSLRRLRLISAEVSPVTLPADDEVLVRRLVGAARRRTLLLGGLGFAGVLLVTAAILLVVGLSRRRRRVAGRLIENLPLSVRVGLAVDLVALEHNFVSKGNWPAAVARLREIRDRAGLGADVDLRLVVDSIQPHYAATITRLIDGAPTDPVLEFITTAARRARPDAVVHSVETTRERLAGALGEPGFRVICIRNREYPDVYGRLRWFSSPRLRSVFEHLVVDHLRYARDRGAVVLDYTVSTQWNRKLTITLYSDSVESIDLGQRDGHLVSELSELASGLRPALDMPGPDWRPADPEEKLWLRLVDLISVLEETRARLQTTERGLESGRQ